MAAKATQMEQLKQILRLKQEGFLLVQLCAIQGLAVLR